MIDELYSLYRKIEDLDSKIEITKLLPFKSEEYISQKILGLELELKELKKSYEECYNKNLEEIKTISNDYLQTFLQAAIKYHTMPRYGLQGIFEDYQKDDVEDEENVELQYHLQRYHYGSYQQCFKEALENYRKILFILKLIGENE